MPRYEVNGMNYVLYRMNVDYVQELNKETRLKLEISQPKPSIYSLLDLNTNLIFESIILFPTQPYQLFPTCVRFFLHAFLSTYSVEFLPFFKISKNLTN